jgi:hypothetical protein
MGINKGTFELFLKTLDFSQVENILTFGSHGVEVKEEYIKSKLKFYNKKINHNVPVTYDPTTHYDGVSQKSLFNILGIKTVESLDYFEHENATHIADLNEILPTKLYNKYNLVYDGGTLEHVFNISNGLKNVVKVLKNNGNIVHVLPVSGAINHGFFQVSPILLFDFYSKNGFTDLKCFLYYKSNGNYYYTNYHPSDNIPNDFFGRSANLYFIATKGSSQTEINNPIQGHYLDMNSKRMRDESKIQKVDKNKKQFKRRLFSALKLFIPEIIIKYGVFIYKIRKYKKLA